MDKEMQTTPVFLPGEVHGQTWQATVHGVAKSWTWLSNYYSLTQAYSIVIQYFYMLYLHLKLVQNNSFIPHAVQYSLVIYFIHDSLYLLIYLSPLFPSPFTLLTGKH